MFSAFAHLLCREKAAVKTPPIPARDAPKQFVSSESKIHFRRRLCYWKHEIGLGVTAQ